LPADVLDLLVDAHLAERESVAEAQKGLVFGAGHRLAASELPERQQSERQALVLSRFRPRVDAQLGEVEEHAVVQRPLIDVGADLKNVGRELLV
jgi:hypothetical protein